MIENKKYSGPAVRMETRYFEPDEEGIYKIRGMKIDVDQSGNITRKGWNQIDEILRIYRDKRAETFRYLFIGPDGMIKSHTAVDARLPDRTKAYKYQENLPDIKRQAMATKSRVIFVHNHPNGDPTPSDADIETTKSISGFLNEGNLNIYAGHIILDHGTYTASCPDIADGKWRRYDTERKWTLDPLEKETTNEIIKADRLTENNLIKIGREINGKDEWNDGKTVPIAFTHQNIFVAVGYYPKEFFERARSDIIRQNLKKAGQSQGATHAVPFILSENMSPALESRIKELAAAGFFKDVYCGGKTLDDMGLGKFKDSPLRTEKENEDAMRSATLSSTFPVGQSGRYDAGGMIREENKEKNKGEETMKIENIKDYAEKLIENGAEVIQASKTASVQARKGTPGEKIETILKNGHSETENIVQKDELGNPDWVVKNPNGEEYVVPDKKFNEIYRADPEKEGVYLSSGEIRPVIQISENIAFTAPWGEEMNIKQGGYLVIKDMNGIYGIAEDEFNQTYKILEKEPEKKLGFFDAEILPGMTASPVFADYDKSTGKFYFVPPQIQSIYNKPGIDLKIQKSDGESFNAHLVRIAEGNWYYSNPELQNKERSAIANYAEKTLNLLEYLEEKREIFEPGKGVTTITGSLAEKVAEEEKTAFRIFEKSNMWTVSKEPKLLYIDGTIFRMYEVHGNKEETKDFKTSILVSEAELHNKNGRFVEEFARGYAAAAEYFEPEWEVNRISKNGADKAMLFEAGNQLKKSLVENSQRMLATVVLHKQNAAKGVDKDKIGKEFLERFSDVCPKTMLQSSDNASYAYTMANAIREELLSYESGDPKKRGAALDKYLRNIGIEDPSFRKGDFEGHQHIKEKVKESLLSAMDKESSRARTIIERMKQKHDTKTYTEKKQEKQISETKPRDAYGMER